MGHGYSSNLVDTSQTSVFMYKDPLYIIEIKRNIYQSKRIYWLQVYHLCSPLCYLYYFWYKLSKNPRVSNEQGSVGWRGAAGCPREILSGTNLDVQLPSRETNADPRLWGQQSCCTTIDMHIEIRYEKVTLAPLK